MNEFRAASAGQQTQHNFTPARPKGVPNLAFPGDRIHFTVGREMYAVASGFFEVGPVMFETSVGPGEATVDAYGRAVAVAYAMFEAEFQAKRAQYFSRLAQVEAPRG